MLKTGRSREDFRKVLQVFLSNAMLVFNILQLFVDDQSAYVRANREREPG
jgi:hypothetical protein